MDEKGSKDGDEGRDDVGEWLAGVKVYPWGGECRF